MFHTFTANISQTLPNAFRNTGGKELFARVKELIEYQHEENASAIPNKQLKKQEWGTHIHIDVSLVKIPHEEKEGIFNESQHVVHQWLVPAL